MTVIMMVTMEFLYKRQRWTSCFTWCNSDEYLKHKAFEKPLACIRFRRGEWESGRNSYMFTVPTGRAGMNDAVTLLHQSRFYFLVPARIIKQLGQCLRGAPTDWCTILGWPAQDVREAPRLPPDKAPGRGESRVISLGGTSVNCWQGSCCAASMSIVVIYSVQGGRKYVLTGRLENFAHVQHNNKIYQC